MTPCDEKRTAIADATRAIKAVPVLANRLQISASSPCDSDTRAIVYQIITAETELGEKRYEKLERENRTGNRSE